MEMAEDFPAILPSMIAIMGLGLLPFLAVMGTAFTKISIVLMLVRNAIGVQQAPSGLVINSIALTLTVFIMAPVGDAIITEFQRQNLGFTGWHSVTQSFSIISGSFTGYLKEYAAPREVKFFMDAAERCGRRGCITKSRKTTCLSCCPRMSHPSSHGRFRLRS